MAVVVARLPLRLGDARTRVGVALALAVRLALQEPLVDLPLQLVRLRGVDGPQAVPICTKAFDAYLRLTPSLRRYSAPETMRSVDPE